MADWLKTTGFPWGQGPGMVCPWCCLMLYSPVSIHIVLCTMRSRIGDGVAAEPVVPFLGRRLGGERGAGRVVAELHELGWESFEWLVGLVDEPFVGGGQVVGGVFAHGLGHAARLVRRHAGLFGEVGHADVERAVACPARGFRRRA